MKKTCVAVLAIGMAILWAGGCQEEQVSSGEKMARLMALENKGLQEQLQAEKKKCDDDINKMKAQFQSEIKKKDDEIENLKEQSQAQIDKRDREVQEFSDQLAQCEQIKSEEMQKTADKEVWGLVTDLGQKNSELTAEVDRLKAELAQVKGEEKK